VNDQPVGVVELVAGVEQHRFGLALQPSEQAWVVAEVNAFLADVRALDSPRLLQRPDTE
jgi:hypothetical protein